MSQYSADYPNPVLMSGSDDYKEDCSFSVELDEVGMRVADDKIVIPVAYSLISRTLSSLISEGKAAPFVIVRSQATSYRRLCPLGDGEANTRIELNKFDVQDRIDLEGVVVAKEPFKLTDPYHELNAAFFEGLTFDLGKGDVLAKADVLRIYVDDSELEKPLSSIFTITNSSTLDRPLAPDFYNDKIIISCNTELFNLYHSLAEYNGGTLTRFVSGVIILPVLVEALSRVCGSNSSEREELEDYRWYRSVSRKTSALGVKLEDFNDSVTVLADQLLRDITVDSLKQFAATFEQEFNSGEEQGSGSIA